MGIWSGIGMNYGHQFTDSNYDTSQVESDFTYLKAHGLNKIRVAFAGYNDAAQITLCQDMVKRALAHGFYVVWGIDPNVDTIDSTDWSAYKTSVTGIIATWAQSNGLSEFAVGNECDIRADGTTITAATIRNDVLTMVTTVKTGGFTGKVSYSTAALDANIGAWNSLGIGTLDYIGWNNYDTLTNFKTHNASIVLNFDVKGYISEFGSINNGYSDFNNETLFHHDTIDRIVNMIQSGISAGYFFTYRDGGGFGVAPNTFGIVRPNGVAHLALQAVLGVATPFYGKFMTHA